MTKPNDRIQREELTEFIGQILDVFEDYLEEKGVSILNEDRQAAIEAGEDPEGLCILYGSDYGELQSGIKEILYHWDLISRDKEETK